MMESFCAKAGQRNSSMDFANKDPWSNSAHSLLAQSRMKACVTEAYAHSSLLDPTIAVLESDRWAAH